MRGPIRIAMFVGEFPVVSETFIIRQITGLIDLGHRVHIYAEHRSQGSPVTHQEVSRYRLLDMTRYMDIPPESGYWEAPIWPLTGRTWLPGSESSMHNLGRALRALPALARSILRSPRLALQALDPARYGYQARSLSALYRLSRLCSVRDRYHVLHAHFGPVANSYRFIAALWHAPLVVSFHGYDFSAWPRKEGAGVYRRLFDVAGAVTVNSDYSRERLEQLGCPTEKLHKLPMGVDLTHFPFVARALEDGKDVRVLTVGRLVEKKGIEYAIRAVAQARDGTTGLRYDIIGNGPLRDSLERLISELDVHDIVKLHGAQDGTYIQRMMRQSHIFVLPSVTAANGDQEGQGLVLQEAQASGLPVIATDHNGFRESIVPGTSGFIVPERDVGCLTEHLRFLAAHPDIWPEIGRAGRRHVEEHYDAQVLSRKLADLYRQVIVEYRARRS
jgi:colanic acid/amylovoran biosynthesis glycosyltransferase